MEKLIVRPEVANSSFLRKPPPGINNEMNPYMSAALNMAAENIVSSRDPRGSKIASMPFFGGDMSVMATSPMSNGQKYRGLQWTKRF